MATARKIFWIIYHMLTENRPYEERHDDLVYQKRAALRRKAQRAKRIDDRWTTKGIEALMKEDE